MSFVSVRRRVAFIPAASASSYLLLTGREVMAHADHYKTEQHEQPSSDNPQPELSSEPVDTSDPAEQEATPIQQNKSEANGSSTDIENKDKTVAEEISVNQASVSDSESGLFNGFAGIGLGEFLLALIIATPFVLRTLKRQLKS